MVCSHINVDTIEAKVPANTVVYKDDCMYNFDTAENNELGLDVCLNCFQSYSRGDHDYTSEHCKDSSHSNFLNITKRMKPVDEKDVEERQNKMAKLEIKESKEEEVYDIKYHIYCSIDNQLFKLEEVPEKYQQLSESIIKTNSSSRQEEIKAWEQEILPCEHSIEIEQFKSEIDLTKCSQCDLKENLWICLHCGALGCGREQFGSNTPGNSHALKHYEISQHPVAVKLGSLSADDIDNYDAYCYKCNDEVKIPNLLQYLKTFDIDLQKAVKTEKNLIELNLDQNLNWEFQLDGANGEKLKPIFGSNFTGLSNLGNSCYLNSVVQGLFDLDSYQEYFKDKQFPPYKEVSNPSKDLKSQMIKIYNGLASGKYSKPNVLKGDDYQLGIKPTIFKSLIGEDHPEFKTNKQQDAFEFLIYLLDKLDNEYGFELNKSLKSILTSKVLCSNCFKGSARDDLVDNLSLNIEDEVLKVEDGQKTYKEVNLIDSFKQYCEDEIIEGFKCDKCGETTNAIKSMGFKSFPKHLIVNVNRIKLENWVPVKINVPVSIPDKIDLSNFRVEIDDNFEYKKEEKPGFAANEDLKNNLMQMGFPENRCIKALYKTGNNSLDEAMNWLFSHMEDADIDEPLVIEETKSDVSEDLINNVMAMGFDYKLSKKALVVNNSDVNAAVEWLFTHPDDDGEIPSQPVKVNLSEEKPKLIEELTNTSVNPQYNLKSIICHKGTSPHTGHYVIFIKKLINNQEKWVLFNDEKVVECDESNIEDMKTNGYIYIFESS